MGIHYTPEWRGAIKIKHFAQECKHDDPTRIQTRNPLIKGPVPKHFGHRALCDVSFTEKPEGHTDQHQASN